MTVPTPEAPQTREREATLAWLMEGDPSIRWQVQRDLLGEPRSVWEAERSRVALEGWGARLLAERTPNGLWADGLYTPKWTSTTYTLALLRRLGLSPDNALGVASANVLLDERVWLFGAKGREKAETCVAGITLAITSWFDADASQQRDGLIEYVLAEQMPDGGWNCRRHHGATHSSFHTTINVLEGLREFATRNENGLESGERAASHPPSRHIEDIAAAEARAQEFFLEHKLYRSHRTGEVVDPRMVRLPFPPRWHHDNLRTLDYFRAADAPRDTRLTDPIEHLLARQGPDGTWPLQQNYSGKVWFSMEKVGHPSRWNTLRALRVLDWWKSAPADT